MTTTIEVKTQRIVVNGPSGRLTILGYGVEGPPGPPGEAECSPTPPDNPTTGDFWYHTEDGTLLIFYDGTWVEAQNPGEQGPPGPEGPPGTKPISYTHSQGVASSSWLIIHNLGWYPNATVIDSSGSVVEGDLSYQSANQLTLTFSGGFTGIAYLS